MRWIVAILGLLGLLHFTTYRIVKAIQFDRQAEGYLKRAADANTIDLAQTQLEIAVGNLRGKGDTTGYTSILWRTPDEDVGYWWSNLTAALQELEDIPEEATPLERSNLLMKLRETLLDDTGEGTKVTVPPGISIYPYNKGWCIYGCIVIMLTLIGWVWVLIEDL